MTTKTLRVPLKVLMYIDAVVGDKTSRAFIDTSASQNFVSTEEAKRVSRGVKLHLGSSSGTMDFIVIPLDDYEIILEITFMDDIQVSLFQLAPL
ncbi:unnamed protein product [Prunus armeniaca]